MASSLPLWQYFVRKAASEVFKNHIYGSRNVKANIANSGERWPTHRSRSNPLALQKGASRMIGCRNGPSLRFLRPSKCLPPQMEARDPDERYGRLKGLKDSSEENVSKIRLPTMLRKSGLRTLHFIRNDPGMQSCIRRDKARLQRAASSCSGSAFCCFLLYIELEMRPAGQRAQERARLFNKDLEKNKISTCKII